MMRNSRVGLVVDFFSAKKLERILDIGCGEGSISIALKNASRAKEVYGIDKREDLVRKAKAAGVKAYFLDLNSSKLPFEKEFFDAVYAGEIIEHLVDPDLFLQEIRRVLKNGGICVITTPNLASWHNRIALLFGFQPHFSEVSLSSSVGYVFRKPHKAKQQGHLRSFTYLSLKQLAELNGFKITKNLKGNADKRFNFPLTLIDKFFSYFPSLHTHIICVLKKE